MICPTSERLSPRSSTANPVLSPVRRSTASRFRNRKRSPKAWKVLTHTLSAPSGTSADTRSRISPAALLVKVTAVISHGRASPSAISQATLWVRTRVLPLPAPARMRSGPST